MHNLILSHFNSLGYLESKRDTDKLPIGTQALDVSRFEDNPPAIGNNNNWGQWKSKGGLYSKTWESQLP